MDIEFTVRELNEQNVDETSGVNEPFAVTGRMDIKYADNKWTVSEQYIDEPYFKKYADEDIDYKKYIDKEDRAVFLAYDNDKCVGLIRISKSWNGYCFIEDLSIKAAYRRKGAGTILLSHAIAWAKKRKLGGLMLETQDTNLNACLFYKNNGFEVAGVDTMLYANTKNKDDIALFWYLKFKS